MRSHATRPKGTIARFGYLTPQAAFGDVERGNPLPYTLPLEVRRQVGLERETWRLEVVADTFLSVSTPVQVAAIPRTLSGKKMELPVKKLLMGTPPEQVFKLDAMANADCVAWFAEFAARRAAHRP